MTKDMGEIRKALCAPFAAEEIFWRVGNVAKNGKRATMLAYLDSRAVQDRLDDVVGTGNWQNKFITGPDGGVMCGIGIRFHEHGEWVWKFDGAENTAIEAIKGGISGAFKRAGAQWGIGRYLYRLDATWMNVREGWANGKGVDISANRRHIGWCPYPSLPAWALPAGDTTTPRGHVDEPEDSAIDITDAMPALDPRHQRISGGQIDEIRGHLVRLRVPGREWLAEIEDHVGHAVGKIDDLTMDEAADVIARLGRASMWADR